MRRVVAVLLLFAGAAAAYDGKYKDDPRFAAIRARLPATLAAARNRVEAVLRLAPPDVRVRFEDAGRDRSGAWAHTTSSEVVLKTEYLVVGRYDVEATLAHELVHALHRARLRDKYALTPSWVREGMALFVAGQGPARARLLAAHAGADPLINDPVAFLTGELRDGPVLAFKDYYQAAAVFEAMDPAVAIGKIHDLLHSRIQTARPGDAAAHAARTLRPLVDTGRAAFLEALGAGAPARVVAALDAIGEPGVYGPAIAYHKAERLLTLGRAADALKTLRAGLLDGHRETTTLLDHALLLELRLLKALRHPEYALAAVRARKDLEPFPVYPDVERLLRG